VRDFWKDELKAGEWVMDVLQNGYVIPFAKIPPVYEEQNNASATQDMSFVLQAVEDLRRLGVINFGMKSHTASLHFLYQGRLEVTVQSRKDCVSTHHDVSIVVSRSRV
jgi:hypothetical protein